MDALDGASEPVHRCLDGSDALAKASGACGTVSFVSRIRKAGGLLPSVDKPGLSQILEGSIRQLRIAGHPVVSTTRFIQRPMPARRLSCEYAMGGSVTLSEAAMAIAVVSAMFLTM